MSQNERNRAISVLKLRELEQWLRAKSANGAKFGTRYWRRSSTRAMGLFLNGIDRINEMVLG